MRVGRLSSVILVLLVTAMATGVRVFTFWAFGLEHAPPVTRVLIFACVVAMVSAIVLIPMGFLLDRGIAELRRNIESAGDERKLSGNTDDTLGSHVTPDTSGGAATTVASRWLKPVTRTLIGTIDRFRERERALRATLGDLEIRHRVSEAERRRTEAVLHALRDAVIVTDAFDEIVMLNHAAVRVLGEMGKRASSPRRPTTGAIGHRPSAATVSNVSGQQSGNAADTAGGGGHLTPDTSAESLIGRSIDEVIGDERLRALIREARQMADFANPRHVELDMGEAGLGIRGQGSGIRDQGGGPPASLSPEPRSLNAGFSHVYDVMLCCVDNHKGQVAGIVTILHDLTRERELSQLKSDFVSKASHELRTPLSSIRAYVEMLVDGEVDGAGAGGGPDDATRRECYRVIQQETDRLSRMIDNMLNISRIEAGIVQIDREVVDMGALIRRAVASMEPQAREKRLGVHVRLGCGCGQGGTKDQGPGIGERDKVIGDSSGQGSGIRDQGASASLSPEPRSLNPAPRSLSPALLQCRCLCVEGDADMLLQVVLNLLSNAIKYTPEGGRITVSADMDGLGSGAQRAAASPSPSAIAGAATIVASVIVTVADTGLGIPPDALPKLFDKFYRVENYKRIAKGTGLGLSLCKHIVETAHRGQIGVDSELGMGSKFWFSIPVHYAGSALNKAA